MIITFTYPSQVPYSLHEQLPICISFPPSWLSNAYKILIQAKSLTHYMKSFQSAFPFYHQDNQMIITFLSKLRASHLTLRKKQIYSKNIPSKGWGSYTSLTQNGWINMFYRIQERSRLWHFLDSVKVLQDWLEFIFSIKSSTYLPRCLSRGLIFFIKYKEFCNLFETNVN